MMEQHSLHTDNKVTFLVFSDNYLFIFMMHIDLCVLLHVLCFVLYQLYLQMIVIKINLSCTFGDI